MFIGGDVLLDTGENQQDDVDHPILPLNDRHEAAATIVEAEMTDQQASQPPTAPGSDNRELMVPLSRAPDEAEHERQMHPLRERVQAEQLMRTLSEKRLQEGKKSRIEAHKTFSTSRDEAQRIMAGTRRMLEQVINTPPGQWDSFGGISAGSSSGSRGDGLVSPLLEAPPSHEQSPSQRMQPGQSFPPALSPQLSLLSTSLAAANAEVSELRELEEERDRDWARMQVPQPCERVCRR